MKKRTVLILLCIAFLFYLVPVTSIQSTAYDTENSQIANCTNLIGSGEPYLQPSYLSSYMIYSNSVSDGPFTRAVLFTAWNGYFLYLTVVAFGTPGRVTDDIWVEFWVNTHSEKDTDATDRFILSPSRLARTNKDGLFTDLNALDHQDSGLICSVRRQSSYNNYPFNQCADRISAFGWVSSDQSYCVATAAISYGLFDPSKNAEFKNRFVTGTETIGLQFTVAKATYRMSEDPIKAADNVVENAAGSQYYLIGGWFKFGETNATIQASSFEQDTNQIIPLTSIPTHSWFVKSITVSWNVPVFELQYSNWNTVTHQYDTKAVKGTATVTVTNNSKLLDLNITPSFSKTGDWKNYFDGVLSTSALTRVGHDPTNSGSSRPNSETFSLTLNTNNSTPSTLSGQVQVGTFTVKLSSPYQS